MELPMKHGAIFPFSLRVAFRAMALRDLHDNLD
jgi:hypothetical protein